MRTMAWAICAVVVCAPVSAAIAQNVPTVAAARAVQTKDGPTAAHAIVDRAIPLARARNDRALLADWLQFRAELLAQTDVVAGEAALREAIVLRATAPQSMFRKGEDIAMLGMLRLMQNQTADGLAKLREGVGGMAAGATTREQREEAAGALVSLGDAEAARGDITSANATIARAVDALEALKDAPSFPTAVAWTNLADYMLRTGDGDRALAFARRSLAERAAVQPADHPEIVDAIGVAGDAEFRFGDIDAAERLYRRALAIVDARIDVMPAQASRAYQNLGRFYMRLDRPELALPLYRQGATRMLAFQVERASQLRADAAAAADSAGDRPAAVAEITAAITSARREGVPKQTLGSILLTRAGYAIDERAFDRAESDLDEAAALYAASLRADSPRHADVLAQRAMLAITRGPASVAATACAAALDAMTTRPATNATLIAVRARCAAPIAGQKSIGEGYALARAAADAQTGIILAQAVRPVAGSPTDRGGVFTSALDRGWDVAKRPPQP